MNAEQSRLNLGHIITIATTTLTLLVGGVAGYITLNNTIATLQERLNNHVQAFQELRATQNNQWRMIGQLQTDVATLKAQRGI